MDRNNSLYLNFKLYRLDSWLYKFSALFQKITLGSKYLDEINEGNYLKTNVCN